MGAPFGNKNALGHGKGRPRTVCPEDDDLIILGEEMIEWVSTNNCVHLSEWWCIEKMILEKVWEQMTDKVVFQPYYKKALKMIGCKYLREDTGIEPRIKDRWLRIYFKDLRKQEDDDKDADMLRQKTIAEAVPEDVKAQTKAMMDQTKALREAVLGKEQ